MNKEKKSPPSTYERLIHDDADFAKDLKKKYHEFIHSEFLLAVIEEDHLSIKKLVKEAEKCA